MKQRNITITASIAMSMVLLCGLALVKAQMPEQPAAQPTEWIELLKRLTTHRDEVVKAKEEITQAISREPKDWQKAENIAFQASLKGKTQEQKALQEFKLTGKASRLRLYQCHRNYVDATWNMALECSYYKLQVTPIRDLNSVQIANRLMADAQEMVQVADKLNQLGD
jgi:hypothetical protein